MGKQEIIDIVTSMGFRLDYDQFHEPMKEWMRFQLKDELMVIWESDFNKNKFKIFNFLLNGTTNNFPR